jgi:hypothetical protein
MPQTQTRDQERAPACLPRTPQRLRYLLVRRQGTWFITFRGEEFGPYRSKREAKLFAIEAAHELAGYGKETEVMVADEAGEISPVWIHGQHAYPPRGQV